MDTRSNFNFSRVSQVKITSSLILRMIDSFTGKAPAVSRLSVSLAGSLARPIVKGNEYFIFTNLPKGKYRIIVRSNHYFQIEKEVVIDEEERVFNIFLYPNKAYPWQENATMIFFQLRNHLDEPLELKKVKLVITDPKCAVGKVAQEKIQSGIDVIKVAKLSQIFIGDYFLIVDCLQNKSEYCQIAEEWQEPASYKLSSPISQPLSRGALLLPVVSTFSGRNGETILLVRQYAQKRYQAKLEIEHDAKTFTKELLLQNGEKKYLGVIKIE